MLHLMTDQSLPELTRIAGAHQVTTALRHELTDCWIAVTNAGGADGWGRLPERSREAAGCGAGGSAVAQRNSMDASPAGVVTEAGHRKLPEVLVAVKARLMYLRVVPSRSHAMFVAL